MKNIFENKSLISKGRACQLAMLAIVSPNDISGSTLTAVIIIECIESIKLGLDGGLRQNKKRKEEEKPLI